MPENEETLDLLKRFVRDYSDATTLQRAEGERAHDYRDGIQWTAEEIALKEKRHEPALTFNYIAQGINFQIGSEIRSRVDPKALPITSAHESDVEAATQALRSVAEAGEFDDLRTDILEELWLSGLAAAIACVDTSKKRPQINLKFIPASRFFYDPHSSRKDYADAKYLGVANWWDVEDLNNDAQYSKAKDVIDQLGGSSSAEFDFAADKPELWMSTDRKRVQVFEIYWKKRDEWWTAHFCHAGFFVKPQKVPYLDEDGNSVCPIIAATAFITRDNVRYGVARNLFDPQDEINHRRSKALRDMSVRGAIAERSAVLDPTGFLTELAKPDCFAIVEDDALKEQRIILRDSSDMAMGQLQMLADAKSAIGAVEPSSAPLPASPSSGREVMARQALSSIGTEVIFNQLRNWSRRFFTLIWWMIRQYWTEEMWLRATDSESRNGYQFVGLNRRMTRAGRLQELLNEGVALDDAVKMIDLEPCEIAQIQAQAQEQAMMIVVQKLGGDPRQLPPEQQQQLQPQIEALTLQIALQSPKMREPFVAANIAKLSMDIKIDVAPDVATLQQEQYEILSEMIGRGIFQLSPEVLELVIEASQLRDKDKLLKKLKEMRESPQAGQQMQMQAQMQMMQAQLGKLVAEIDQIKSQTILNLAKAQAEEPKSMGEQAWAVTTMMDAGRKSVPQHPAMAAGPLKGKRNV